MLGVRTFKSRGAACLSRVREREDTLIVRHLQKTGPGKCGFVCRLAGMDSVDIVLALDHFESG
jgi:hypothetical protein